MSGMTKCPESGCKSYFACQDDLQEHISQQHTHILCREVATAQHHSREEILHPDFKGRSAAPLGAGAGTATDTRRTNATTASRGATSAASDAANTRGISVTGNEGSLVFVGRSTTSETGLSKSGLVSVTKNERSMIFCGSSGSSSTSGAGQNASGDLIVTGNRGLQLFLTPSRSSSTSGGLQSQPGSVIVRDNVNSQLLSDGSKAGKVEVRKNVDLQLYHGASPSGTAENGANVEGNKNSLVFIPNSGGQEVASDIQRDVAEGAAGSVTRELAQD